ncbi:MAG TPA: hypothetical protein PLY35_08285 [Thermotogota bacterium]|nr:hypothetical protein [Thermotogota bacterium]
MNESKKTILLLSDDIRAWSGVGTVSKKIVEKTLSNFNWVQIGGMLQVPSEMERYDLSEEYAEKTGIQDASVIVYSSSGYGDYHKLMYVLNNHKIDAILHFTDPRYWEWLYNIEYELRVLKHIPIVYYHVWDNYPAPKYNIPFYKCSDLILTISKQTHAIVKELIPDCIDLDINKKYEYDKLHIKYVPHGIDKTTFKPLSLTEPGNIYNAELNTTEYDEMLKLKDRIFNGKEYKYVILFNNRNISRKLSEDLILAYNNYCNTLSKEDADKTLLIMHTNPIDQYGSNLFTVVNDICNYPVYFSTQKLDVRSLNMLYNIVTVTINVSNAEGFGLSTAESLMAGTPIIVNVTGGLQDQCGFTHDDGTMIENYTTNHDKRYGMVHGDWAHVIFPHQTLNGSITTPYIYDDYVSINQIQNALAEFANINDIYNTSEIAKERGKRGREYLINNKFEATDMANEFINNLNFIIENFFPRKKIRLTKV